MISVIDTGIGISSDLLKRLFKIYGTIKMRKGKYDIKRNGIGFGLELCQHIVNHIGPD